VFEVLDGSTTFTVNLAQHHCDCMMWDISGIPCKHGIRCILRERQDINSYVHESYTIKSFLQTYDVIMHPIKYPIFWKEMECPKLRPLPVQFKRSRPPSKRRRDITEKRKVYTRSNPLRHSKCKQFGQNSKSYKEGNVLEIRRKKDKPRKPKVGDKKRVGRPSKIDENTSKKAKTTQGAPSQPTIATTSTSQPKNQELLHLSQQDHNLLQLDKQDLKLFQLGKPDPRPSRLEVSIFQIYCHHIVLYALCISYSQNSYHLCF